MEAWASSDLFAHLRPQPLPYLSIDFRTNNPSIIWHQHSIEGRESCDAINLDLLSIVPAKYLTLWMRRLR